MALRALLFDLDGTLVQTREASWELFQLTNAEFALGIDDRKSFFDLFEQNFFRALAARCPDTEKLAAVKRHFLGLLRTRYTPPLVPGMADVVRTLAGRFTLVVLSTNTIATIRRILTEAGISHCFAHVFAGDVEPDKSVSMRRFLADAGYGVGRRCSPAYDEKGGPGNGDAEAVLVTDTVGDVKEARASGVRALGVAWGMHSEAELLAAGAEMVAIWPQELIAWLAADETCGCESSAHGACACAPATSACAPLAATARAAEPVKSAARERVADAAKVRRARRPDALPSPVVTPRVATRAPPLGFEPDLLATLRRLHSSPGPRTRALEASKQHER
jgi:phosphoglycolate phosphatase